MRPLSAIEREYQNYCEALEEERARGVFNIAKPEGNASTSSITTVEAPSFEVKLNEDLPVTDIKRHLHRKLYFAFKDAITGCWQLPSGLISPGDELPQRGLHAVVQEALSKIFAPSSGLEFYHVGAAPVAVFSEAFADRVEPPLGAKHFFFRTQLLAEKVKLSNVQEFGWFVKEELKSRLNEKYYASIEPVLSE